MNKSDSISKLSAALSKAQSKMENPAFDTVNPHFKSRFASLPAVREATIPILNAHGISAMQFLGGDDAGLTCETVLMHESGEWVSGTFYMPVSKKDPQGYGSAATYARRYSLQAVCGVVGDEDDDGNDASKKKPETAKSVSQVAWEALSEEVQGDLQTSAMDAMTMLNRGDIEGAYEHIESLGLDADHKAAIWYLFDSKQRAALKKEGEKRRNAA